jgi:HK97 gp10 family phage protein
MTVSAKLDVSGWTKALDKLAGEKRVSLARSMCVAGGKVFEAEAKLQAPVKDGVLQNAIYLAFKDAESTAERVKYSVSWNHRKAPHGHLIEFGHWQPYKVVKLPNGDWFTTKEKLPSPKWISAKPFLRPAYDMAKERAVQAMIERGKQRLPELLAENENGD